jgi:hypothetical protein
MRVVLPTAAVVAAAGIALSVYGIMAPPYVHPPTPSSSADRVAVAQTAAPFTSRTSSKALPAKVANPRPGTTVSTHPRRMVIASHPKKTGVPIPRRSAPVQIAVSAIGVASRLGPARGLKPDGTVADAPLSGPTWSLPWWYSAGPAPGQRGSAVILGHVDSAQGAGHLGVLFKIGDLRPGEEITVTLADGLLTRWIIASARLYVDGAFPNALIYAQTGSPTLRLVTCGGNFDWQTHEYESATVVTAHPLGVR